MNWIEKMIAEQCPNGVKYVPIKNIAKCSMGEFVHKSKQAPNAPYPVYNGGISNTGYYEQYNTEENKVIVSARGAGAGFVNVIEQKFWAGNSCHVISVLDSKKTNYKYLFYVLKTKENELMGKQQRGGIPAVSKVQLETTSIPLPPLSIQKEIVNVLDKFSELIEKTDEEIALRQKQYEYYREKLLTFEKGEVEWKTLPNFSTNQDKKRKPITGSERIKGNYPYYGASGIVDYVEGYIFDGDYLLISEDGANLVMRSTPIAFGITGKNWVNNHAHVIEFDNRCTQRIVELYLNSIDLTPWISGGAQPKLNQENLNKIPIPLPSLSRQQEIVATLDKFEALISKLKEERELRQKQYEYYREKLLTF